jgi:hypothetical protein
LASSGVDLTVAFMKRWMVALASLLVGGGVSAALLIAADPERYAVDVYVAAHDLPAGAGLAADAIRLARVSSDGGTATLFTRDDLTELTTMRAAHDLSSNQLIQRNDVIGATAAADSRLVFLPVKDAPAAPPGSKVDLLVIGGTPDHPTVQPFAAGVPVESSAAGGIVIVVPSRQAAAFVFAAGVMHLVAVVAKPGAADGEEIPISSPDEAAAVAANR